MKLFIAVGVVLAILGITEADDTTTVSAADSLAATAAAIIAGCYDESNVNEEEVEKYMDDMADYGFATTQSNVTCAMQCIHVEAGLMVGEAPFDAEASANILTLLGNSTLEEEMLDVMEQCSNRSYVWTESCDWTSGFERCCVREKADYMDILKPLLVGSS